MNSTQASSGDLSATRKATVREALLHLNSDLLTVPAGTLGTSERQLARFLATLAELGPVFSQFGRYLGTRHDLFRPEVCRAFRDTGTVVLPAADALARAHAQEFPAATSDWLSKLRPEADRSGHLVHYYRWPGHPHLSLRLLNSSFLKLWGEDQHLLARLAGPSSRLWPRVPLKDVLADFKKKIEQLQDLEATAVSYRHFADFAREGDHGESKQFLLPETADEFCGPGVLGVLEPEPGASSPTAHAAFQRLAEGDQREAIRTGVARDLCLLWLHSALRGPWFPVEVTPGNLGLAASGSPAILGGPLAVLNPETQDILFRYLCAVAAHQPDVAADILVSNLRSQRRAKTLEEVRDLFRQIVPFRDGQINRTGDHELFAEHVLVQLRVIREAGYVLDSELLAFQESFASLAQVAHDLSPRRDAFKDALYEIRWGDSLANLRELFSLSTAASQGQAWLDLMMEIPQKMNLAAQGRGIGHAHQVAPREAPSRAASPTLLVFAHFFVLLLLGWLTHAVLTEIEESHFLATLLILSIIGLGISMIRSLRLRE